MTVSERWRGRILGLGWLLVAAPIAFSAIAAWRRGWIPLGDAAIVSAKMLDTASFDPPLVGGWTSLGRFEDEPLHHAGPLAMWIVALPARALGAPGGGLVLGAAAISLVSLALIAVAVRRWRSPAVEIVLLALAGAMVAALGGDRLSDPNSPYLGVMPLLLTMVATSGVVAGHPRQFWLVIGAGSIAAQTHLGYGPLVLAALAITIGAFVVESRRRPELRPLLWRRVVPIGIGIGLVAWIGPIIDQLTASRNLSRLISVRMSSEEPTLGLRRGLQLLVDTTAVPGGWMRGRAREGTLPEPGALATVAAVAFIGAVIALLVWAVRRRDRLLTSLTSVALAGAAVGTASTAGVTRIAVGEGLLYYRLFWWPVGVMFTLALVVGALRVGAEAVGADAIRRLPPRTGLIAAVVAVLLVVGLFPAAYSPPNEDVIALLAPTDSHARAIAELPSSPESVVLLLSEPDGSDVVTETFPLTLLSPTLIVELRLRGIDVRFPPSEFDAAAGPIAAYEYENPTDGHEAETILFRAGTAALSPAPPGFTLLAVDEAGADGAIPSAVYVRDT